MEALEDLNKSIKEATGDTEVQQHGSNYVVVSPEGEPWKDEDGKPLEYNSKDDANNDINKYKNI